MSKIYLIPGLGTDARIFAKIIPLLNCNNVECLEYVEPLTLNESIPEYSKRIVEKLPATTTPPILIGMSLGGTIATEMSYLMPCKKLIVISSFKHRDEIPFLFKIAKILPLHLLIPAWFIRISVPFFARILRICNKEETKELKAMLNDRTSTHFAWGRRAIVKWNNKEATQNYLHINGSKDHIFMKANKTVLTPSERTYPA